MTGLRPIVEVMFVDLIGVCYDQIINQAAKMHYMMGGQVALPLVIRTAYGSARRQTHLRRRRGGAAFADALLGARAHPRPEGRRAEHRVQRQGAARSPRFATTVRSSSWSTSFSASREGRRSARALTRYPIGKAEDRPPGQRRHALRHRPDDPHLPRGRATAGEPTASSAEVIDVLTLAPLDEETILESVRRTHRLVVVDEDNPVCVDGARHRGARGRQGVRLARRARSRP